jgi:hypothetical protein
MLLAHLERARTLSDGEKATAPAERIDEARRGTQADRGQTDEESACRAAGATRAADPGYFARSTRLSATSTPTADAPTRWIEAAAVLGNIVCSGATWVVARTFDGPVFIQRSGLMDRREKKDDLVRLAKQEMKSGSSADARQLLLQAIQLDASDTQLPRLFREACRAAVTIALRGAAASRKTGNVEEGSQLLDEVADCGQEQQPAIASERKKLKEAADRRDAEKAAAAERPSGPDMPFTAQTKANARTALRAYIEFMVLYARTWSTRSDGAAAMETRLANNRFRSSMSSVCRSGGARSWINAEARRFRMTVKQALLSIADAMDSVSAATSRRTDTRPQGVHPGDIEFGKCTAGRSSTDSANCRRARLRRDPDVQLGSRPPPF